MNGSTDKIELLVSALPELYQPIYGFPHLSEPASRSTEDRLADICAVYSSLSASLGRPLRVLDLGCAQGFISFSLAALGGSVVGVDMLEQNIELCRALGATRPDLDVNFVQGRVEEYVACLEKGHFDMVLVLSVIHHVAFHASPELAEETITKVRRCSKVLIAELAVREEPLYWASALPASPASIFGDARFVRCVRETCTHLSEIVRPTYFVSDDYWYACGNIERFHEVKRGGHRFAKDSFKDSRYYYFSDNFLLKLFSLDGEDSEINLAEILREAEFLRNSAGADGVPRLIGVENDTSSALLIREKIPGRLLMDIIDNGEDFDYYIVLKDVLSECIRLERSGLYHQDIRVWNILQCSDGRYRLIDYGAISSEKRDCFWPQNIYISFIIFVKELVSAPNIVSTPIREVAVSPFGFPGHLSAWIGRLSDVPLHEWSFERLLSELEQAFLTPGATVTEPATARDALLKMLEEAVTVLAKALNGLELDSRIGRVALDAAVLVEGERVSNLHNDLIKVTEQIDELEGRAAVGEAAVQRLENIARVQVDSAAEVMGRLDAVEEVQKRVSGVLDGTAQNLGVLRQDVSSVLGSTEALGARLDALDGSFAGAVESLQVKVDDFSSQHRDSIKQLSESNMLMEQRLATGIRQVFDTELSLLDAKVSNLERKIDALASAIESSSLQLQSENSMISARIDSIAARVLRKGFWSRMLRR